MMEQKGSPVRLLRHPGGKLRPGDLPQVPLELPPQHTTFFHPNFPTPLPPMVQNRSPPFQNMVYQFYQQYVESGCLGTNHT